MKTRRKMTTCSRVNFVLGMLVLLAIALIPLAYAEQTYTFDDPRETTYSAPSDILKLEIKLNRPNFEVKFDLRGDPKSFDDTSDFRIYEIRFKPLPGTRHTYQVKVWNDGYVEDVSGNVADIQVSGNSLSFKTDDSVVESIAGDKTYNFHALITEQNPGFPNGQLRDQVAGSVTVPGLSAGGPNSCDPSKPHPCDDHIACTSDSCDIRGSTGRGHCRHVARDDWCAEGFYCSVQHGGCVPYNPDLRDSSSCTTNADCDDGVSCTFDTCVDNKCVNIPNDNVCGEGRFCDPNEGRCREDSGQCSFSVSNVGGPVGTPSAVPVDVYLVPLSNNPPVKGRPYGLDIFLKTKGFGPAVPFTGAELTLVYDPSEVAMRVEHGGFWPSIGTFDISRTDYDVPWLLYGFSPVYEVDRRGHLLRVDTDPTDGTATIGVGGGLSRIPQICPWKGGFRIGTVWVIPKKDEFTIRMPPPSYGDPYVEEQSVVCVVRPSLPSNCVKLGGTAYPIHLEVCDPATESCPSECSTNADCDDGLYCNGQEQCQQGVCVSGTPPQCDDGIQCTVDTCDENTDSCVFTPDNNLCPQGRNLVCDPSQGCVKQGTQGGGQGGGTGGGQGGGNGGGQGGPGTSGGCTEDWVCGEWTACVNGEQTRSCVDRNQCGTTTNKPETTRACEGGSTNTFEVGEGNPCEQIGVRSEGLYCSTSKKWERQKLESAACENNFECKSNFCVDGNCTQPGLLTRIINFFKRLFGIE